MAFPVEFLDFDDIGREVLVTLTGGIVSHIGTLTGIHAVMAGDRLEVSVDTDDREGLVLQPESYVNYTDGK